VTAVFVRQGGKSGIRADASARSKREDSSELERGVFSNVGTKGGERTGRACRRAGKKWQIVEIAST